ncbi:MAG: substrate-binding domain-containing protein [Nocardioides sp.]
MATREPQRAAEARPGSNMTSRVVVRILAGLVVFGLLVAGAVVVLSNFGARDTGSRAGSGASGDCPEHTLRLAVDPAIATAVTRAAVGLGGDAGDQDCLAVEVAERPSAEVAAELSRPTGTGLSVNLPDAWIPDSSAWIDFARRTDVGAARLDQRPESLATSPLVLAVDSAKARKAGWPAAQPAWSKLLGAKASDWRVGMTDPQVSTAGLAALLALRPGSDVFATIGRRVELPPTADKSPAAIVADGEMDVMPTAEYDVARVAERGGAVVASYDRKLGGALDFPLIGVAPDKGSVTERVAADLERLRSGLAAEQAQRIFAAEGFRSVVGALSEEFTAVGDGAESGVIGAETAGPLRVAPKKADQALRTWAQVGRRSRLLILLDVSQSMEETLPGGRVSKMDLAKRSLRRLIDASAPDSELGLWTFTTGRGKDVTKRIVDVGPLGEPVSGGVERRARLREEVAKLAPVPDGGTPLYRATLAAYAAAKKNYSFGRYNAVIVVTDGRDEDDARAPIPVSAALDRLQKQYDGMRPLEIISLAYGAEADFTVLRQFSDITGGVSYRGLTQKQVNRMLASALAAR